MTTKQNLIENDIDQYSNNVDNQTKVRNLFILLFACAMGGFIFACTRCAKNSSLLELMKAKPLIRLGTYKKVEVEFKEAYTFLPKTVSQSLVVNVDKIREKLQ